MTWGAIEVVVVDDGRKTSLESGSTITTARCVSHREATKRGSHHPNLSVSAGRASGTGPCICPVTTKARKEAILLNTPRTLVIGLEGATLELHGGCVRALGSRYGGGSV